MGGKGELINYKVMEELHQHGCRYLSEINASTKKIEERITKLRSSNLAGEKGVAYRKELNDLSMVVNELARIAEKAAIYMDAKLNVSKKNDEDSKGTETKLSKINYLGLKK